MSPRMLVWWFSHLEGEVMVNGCRINRYRAWLRHNIEEVGAFEQFLPALYRRETGGDTA